MSNLALNHRGNSTALLDSNECYEPLKADSLFIENSEWLTTEEAAIYLRKVFANGEPNTNPIHKMVSRGLIRKRKFGGRLYFRKRELDYLIETSATYKK